MQTNSNKPLSTEPQLNTTWLPVFIGILLFTLTLVFWWTLREADRADTRNLVKQHADKLSADIQADLRSRIPALQRIVDRWEFNEGTSKASFLDDAGHYIHDLPGFQAIGWVDKNFRVTWIVPMSGNEQAVGLDLGFEKNRRISLEKAKMSKTTTMTDTIELVQGGKGFIVYFPIYINHTFDGFISAVFRTQPWLDHIFRTEDTFNDYKYYGVNVEINGIPIYKQKEWNKLQKNSFDETTSTKIIDHQFTITCRPTELFFDHHGQSHHPSIVLLVGTVMAILIAFVVHLLQKTSTEAWRTYSAQKTLEFEVQNHENTTAELQHASARLTLAAKAGKIGIWVWDIAADTLTWNDRMFELYDIPSDINPNYETWRGSLHPEDAEEADTKLKYAVAGKGTFDTQFRIVNSAGEIKHIHAAAKVERDAKNKAIRMTGVNWDVTNQKETEEQIRHMATHDLLTGLPTLKLAKDRVGMAFAIAQRKELLTAVMFVDLDGFKNVNDTLGHDAGDAVLQETAKRLLSCVRKVDTVARIGGDEFLIVLNELNSKEDMETIAGKIVTSIAMPFIHKSNQVTVGASVGIAVCTASCSQKDIEGLIKQADEAMYSIKKTGKNGYAFAESENLEQDESNKS
ncbi:sensor domain-containing diguanylate cyclase [Maridesulfovibrio frigidus]|uniref:sensor domain-containing diguanylate cyclase n=1 Tax=Maridesulfovibrio frigidus TaxID=340956 RepID=UPI0004E245C1|nr:diguanylate cyclase [Maridesulfovibrio frigidus]